MKKIGIINVEKSHVTEMMIKLQNLVNVVRVLYFGIFSQNNSTKIIAPHVRNVYNIMSRIC